MLNDTDGFGVAFFIFWWNQQRGGGAVKYMGSKSRIAKQRTHCHRRANDAGVAGECQDAVWVSDERTAKMNRPTRFY
ncbi:hypothetical protein [Xenorhabdus anantnagensis]|uniref:Uncharacterized protein n=1 Tax=Xenorhabdus anantnagensis TaxID=3025875 RepID=A0ABT5LWH4_9GAMM|nr:hypothetical protein [Xenorhabdus anantnagensis]MDC9597350.1 hypothetical protein [Xenorhabdus anantnagensis]